MSGDAERSQGNTDVPADAITVACIDPPDAITVKSTDAVTVTSIARDKRMTRKGRPIGDRR